MKYKFMLAGAPFFSQEYRERIHDEIIKLAKEYRVEDFIEFKRGEDVYFYADIISSNKELRDFLIKIMVKYGFFMREFPDTMHEVDYNTEDAILLFINDIFA